jgi:hypothetical protein
MIRLINSLVRLSQTPLLVRVAVVEFLVIVALGAALCYQGGETVRTVVKRDTTQTTKVDTVWMQEDGLEEWSLADLPDPTLLQAAQRDTTVEESPDSTAAPDTVYISRIPPIQRYSTPVTNPHFTGTITSTVQGSLLHQELDYSLRTYRINRLKTQTIRTRTTHYQRERFRLNAGFSVGANSKALTQLTPMIGLEMPGRWQFYYGFNPLRESHQLTLITPLLTR